MSIIQSTRQLKDKIRNLAAKESANPQTVLRGYMTERFLERIANSRYSGNFILKGGVLVTSLVGFGTRSTMDLDGTIDGETLSLASARKIVGEIAQIDLGDGIKFVINNTAQIMEESEYPGIRISMTASMDTITVPLKVDLSTGDAITPGAVQRSYRLMFEDRSILLLSYNLETVLAEKLETLITRATANTRMRDFYDIYVLWETHQNDISAATLTDALQATCVGRGTTAMLDNAQVVFCALRDSLDMKSLWRKYQDAFNYARSISWEIVLESAAQLADAAGLQIGDAQLDEHPNDP